MSWIQRLGDLLAIPQDVIVAGGGPLGANAWHMRRLLRMHGVHVYRIRTERAAGAPWWNRWDKQADVVVGRYEDIVAADILREAGYDVKTPAEGAQYAHVPHRYALRLHAIAMQRRRLQQAPSVTPQRPQWPPVPAWVRR